MSIDNKLTYLQQTKEVIKTAIQNKGVDVSDADTFRSYAEKIALIEGGGSGGDTTWVYYSGEAVAGDKVMLTKVNSVVTPDDDFCNGFRPYLIMDGWAYGRTGNTSNADYNERRQIVDGVISSNGGTVTTYTSLSSAHKVWCLYLVNGTRVDTCVPPKQTNQSSTHIVTIGDYKTAASFGGRRIFICETAMVGCGLNALGMFFDAVDFSSDSTFIPKFSYDSFCFEDAEQNFYWLGGTNSTPTIYRWNRVTRTNEQLSTPVVQKQTSANLYGSYDFFIQTKDFKCLLNSLAYVDIDIQNNTYTMKDYPAVIKNAIGDRTIYCMQVFYDGYFSIQLSDGTTLMCKYTNSMEDVEIKEIVEPIIVEGDTTIYQRQYSPDRLYWFNYPIVSGSTVVAVPLANNPAGPYKFKEASSDYMAFTPSKDRFNSTVLTGFLTGEIKEEDGRLMVEVRTTGIDLSRKQDKFLIEELLNETILKNNTIFRADEMLNVELFVPEDIDEDFLCEVDFTSGETATAFTMVDTVKWTGDDVTDGSFVPQVSKRYNLIFWHDGVNFNAISRGV